MKVLIIKISSMGDVIHTLPSLTDARYVLKDIHFDWVIEEQFIEIPMWHDSVNCIFPVQMRYWCKYWFYSDIWNKYNNFIYQLRKNYYDAIIDVQGLIKSAALITFLAKGEKHGFNISSIREPVACLFYNKRYKIKKNQHAIERNRLLFSKSLKYSLPCIKRNYGINKKRFKIIKCIKPYLIFIHSSSKSAKLWPEISWRILIKLAYNEGLHIKLPWGTQYEYLRTQRLAFGNEIVEILPALTLTQMSEQILNATAVISVDTGLSHLAVALGRPVITLFGPTCPKLVGNCDRFQKNICSSTSVMNDIKPIYVWNTLIKLLTCINVN